MIDLNIFIKQCERDLISNRYLSQKTLDMFQYLSDFDKKLCTPIINFVAKKTVDRIENIIEGVFMPKDRILVCRLIPMRFALDTDNPAWSSYMLTESITSATSITGIHLSEIGISFLEIFCEFNTPLNKFVYNFCIDISRELKIRCRDRLNELIPIESWSNTFCQSSPAIAFLKYVLVPNTSYKPKFILETIIVFANSNFFEKFIRNVKYLFEDLEYKHDFLQYLTNSELSDYNKKLISSSLDI